MAISAPVVMIAGGAVLLLGAVKALVGQRRIVQVVPFAKDPVIIPAQWNDREITDLLQRYRGEPTVLNHVLSEVRGRMIMNQDIKTARKRLELITKVIDLFKLNRELQGVVHDIHLADKEFEIQQVESQIRLEDSQTRLQSERQLRKLRQQRDEMVLRKEIIQLEDDIGKSAKPAKPEPQQKQPSIDDQITAQEAKIKRYKQESEDRQQSAATPPEAQKWKVFYEDLVNEAQEELKKLLRRR